MCVRTQSDRKNTSGRWRHGLAGRGGGGGAALDGRIPLRPESARNTKEKTGRMREREKNKNASEGTSEGVRREGGSIETEA